MDDAELEAAEEQYIEETPLVLPTSALEEEARLPRKSSKDYSGVKSHGHVSIAEATKYPMESLDTSMKNFVKVLQVDLNRLFRHTVNIARTTNDSNWEGLHQEEKKTARTVHQVSAILREVAKTRHMVTSEDLPAFEWKAKAMLEETLTTMDDILPVIYVDVQRDFKYHLQLLEGQGDGGDVTGSKVGGQGSKSDVPQGASAVEADSKPDASVKESKPGDEKSVSASNESSDSYGTHANPHYPESSVKLQETIQELSDVIHEFFLEMEHQDDSQLTEAEKQATESEGPTLGFTSLVAKAKYYKNAFLPVVGAMVGGVIVGGPVGLAAGAIGGAMGFAGGRYVKKHRRSHDAAEISDALRELIDSRVGPNRKSSGARQKHDSISEEKEEAKLTGEAGAKSGDGFEEEGVTASQSKVVEMAPKSQIDAKGRRGRATSFSDDIASDISEVMHAVAGPIQKLFHLDNSSGDKVD